MAYVHFHEPTEYTTSYSKNYLLAPGETATLDPFWNAAASGSTESLNILLDYYRDEPSPVEPLEKRHFSLATTAASHGELETRGASPCTTELAPQPPSEDGEGLVAWSSFILCSGFDSQSPEQPVDDVLSQAVSRAGYGVVKQLIDAGADVHAKHRHLDQHLFDMNDIHRDSTALHVGSLYWNNEGIQALLDHHHTGSANHSISEMVCSLDGNGRTPLHWAAKGSRLIGCLLPDEELDFRLVRTFKALLAGSSEMVNHKDKDGLTPLHYFIQLHAGCGETKHFENALRILLKAGADPNIKDNKGQSSLHLLAINSIDSEPLNPSILDLLLARGAGIKDVDKDWSTAFHIMAKNLRQIEAAKTLLSAGADPRAENAKGNTPFHELMRFGMLRFRPRDCVRRLEDDKVMVDDRIKAQDDMFNALRDAVWDGMMDQPNAAGIHRDNYELRRGRNGGSMRRRGSGFWQGDELVEWTNHNVGGLEACQLVFSFPPSAKTLYHRP
ncbi:ankyrin repeat-containing domain protein [Penicillium malachiteum]|uniref:ankyrin repeat-containing domain protein n=1 Tax=Penicillium malachiteum TaxID=1324776 RepID=UPI002547173D|nr:ankyrin repeat-containing domain protein [Penicillium malachiteum]KAJ5730394.1 ankyrin repeat-containing domain protein [Penicillium malachiteum]